MAGFDPPKIALALFWKNRKIPVLSDKKRGRFGLRLGRVFVQVLPDKVVLRSRRRFLAIFRGPSRGQILASQRSPALARPGSGQARIWPGQELARPGSGQDLARSGQGLDLKRRIGVFVSRIGVFVSKWH